MLLGIDITARDARIDEVVKEAGKYFLQGQLNEAEQILRAGLKEYPNSYNLMAYLAMTLWNLPPRKKGKVLKVPKEAMAEVISLCEKVLSECVEDTIRYMVIQCLCFTYRDIGEMDKARDLANKMPDKCVSKNYLLNNVLKDKEKFEHIQKEIARDMDQILSDIINLNNQYVFDDDRGAYNLDEFMAFFDDKKGVYNLDECIALHHKVLDIINILCEDGKFGHYNWRLSDAHLHLSYFSIQKKDIDVAVEHLKLSAKHAILYDAIPHAEDDDTEEEFTSLLFRGMKAGIMKSNGKFGLSYNLLGIIERGEFNVYLPAGEINAVADELRKYVNE
jgi:tetratricopeptide (TPR) repeat protein